MKTEEALEKQIIVDVDIETKESAVEALIETCIRNDVLWKAIQECRRDLEEIKKLADDIEVLIRYKHYTDNIPIIRLTIEIGNLTKKVENV